VAKARRPGCFLLTTSANVMTLPRLSESLAGLMEIIPLFACHLLGTDARRLLEDRPLLGRLLGSFVVGELRKQVSWTDPRIALHNFRTATGSEVDVVLDKPDGSIAAIEVKASATVAASDFAALKALRDRLGMRFRAGVMLYLGDQIVPFGDQLLLVPLSALW
jgi:uncharacterized protein